MDETVEPTNQQVKSRKPILFILIIAIVIVLVSFFVFKNKEDVQNNTSNSTNTPTIDISSHNTKEDCWTIIEGNVYNITPFISMHPGKDRILVACGVDATDYFNGKLPKGRLHSNVAREILKKYKVN